MKTLSAKAKINGLKLIEMLVMLAVLAVAQQVAAQSSQFFRILGPAATTITAFNPDGTLVWSNAQSGTNYTVQTVSSLPGGTNWVDYVQIPVTNSVNTNLLISFNPPVGMALIPAGSFTIGNSIGDSDYTNANPTNVVVSAFYMDVNLVSLSQWQSVFNWAATNGYGFSHSGSGKATNHPVQNVDWYDVVKWSNARSQQANLTPVYYTDAGLTQVYTNGEVIPFANWAANGYRMPTEAEWEKAARGGLSGQRFPWGNTISESQANYYGHTNYSYDFGPNGYNATFATGGASGFPHGNAYTSPVGYFTANGYGLFDMAGNVWEWCWDWLGTPTVVTPYVGGIDPHGPTSGSVRVFRGGDWFDDSSNSRCFIRGGTLPSSTFNIVGFRCVKGL